MPYQAFKFFKRNTQGRDFIVGDIHGHFSALGQLLKQVDFNPNTDRVFSVGDLIDRGPESIRVLEYLDYPWFHAIMGNHERMLLDAAENPSVHQNWTTYNGGDWWNKVPKIIQPRLHHLIKHLPLAFEVDTVLGRAGIVHADIPSTCSWPQFISGLYDDPDLSEYALWSRHRFKLMQMTGRTTPVAGIDMIIFGHTPVHQVMQQANIYYIDTGACYPNESQLGKLTLIEMAETGMKLHHIATKHTYPTGAKAVAAV